MDNMKKIIPVVALIIWSSNLFSQSIVESYQNGRVSVIATIGLGHDDQSIVDYFKKYPYWSQATKNEKIEIEFLGFEKESNSVKPFQFGKRKPSVSNNPVLGSTFMKNDGNGLPIKLQFVDYGRVYWSTGSGNAGALTGEYNYVESDQTLYVNMPQAKRDAYKIRVGTGRNLGFSGESVENIQLVNIGNGDIYTKQGQDEKKVDEDNSHWVYPENRFLLKYTLTHDRLMIENGRPITKKNQVEEKYLIVRKFIVKERESPGGLTDYNGIILRDTNYLWKTIEMEVVASVKNSPCTPNMPVEELSASPYGIVNLKLITWGVTSDPNNPFINSSNKNRLYINPAINRAGWDSKDGAILTASDRSTTYEIPENFYLSPSKKDGNNSSGFGIDLDANCSMTFGPESTTKDNSVNIKLTEVLSSELLKLETNSTLSFDKLRDKTYKVEIITKKMLGFGKDKIKKGTWSTNPNNKTLSILLEYGEKREYLITDINEGYIYKFKDDSGKVYALKKVDKK